MVGQGGGALIPVVDSGVAVSSDQVSLGVLVSAVPRDVIDPAVAACGVAVPRHHRAGGRSALRNPAGLNDKGAAELATRGQSLFEAPKGKKLSANVSWREPRRPVVVIEPHNRSGPSNGSVVTSFGRR